MKKLLFCVALLLLVILGGTSCDLDSMLTLPTPGGAATEEGAEQPTLPDELDLESALITLPEAWSDTLPETWPDTLPETWPTVTRPTETETETPKETEPLIPYRVGIEYINGHGYDGADHFEGCIANAEDGAIVFTAADKIAPVGLDFQLTISGWLGTPGGVKEYVYSVDNGRNWLPVTSGGADGEPLPGYYQSLGYEDALSLGMFSLHGKSNLCIDMHPYADSTVTVMVGAVQSHAPQQVISFLVIKDLAIPVDPNYIPMWDEKKDVVKHICFDELRIDGDSSQGVFSPGQSAAWDGYANVDASMTTIDYWGWAVFDGALGYYGYAIDDREPVFRDEFAFVGGDHEIIQQQAQYFEGNNDACRMLISIDISGLALGEHTVRALYRHADGRRVCLTEFTVVVVGNANIDNGVVLHNAFDELRRDGDPADLLFPAGQSSAWDHVANLTTGNTGLDYWGWVAVSGDLGRFAYRVDNGGLVYVADHPTDPAELEAFQVAFPDADNWARVQVPVDLTELTYGRTYSVEILYVNPRGRQIQLAKFSVNIEWVRPSDAPPIVPVDPAGAPMWDEDKDVVKYLSFDELMKNGDSSQGVFSPGQSAAWDGFVNVDASIPVLMYRGWAVFAGFRGMYGYMIDGGEAVFSDDFASIEGDHYIIQDMANHFADADDACRMMIPIDVSGLDLGEHTVRVLYTNTDGQVVCLTEFTVIKTA